MKVLIVNKSDIQGGAARAANRLHKALLYEGVESNMLVQSKKGDDYTVIGPETPLKKGLSLIHPTLDKLPVQLYKKRTKTPFSPAWLSFNKVAHQINELKPDIVHLHWTNGGMLKIKDLKKIKAPIVWTLHDMWAFTGGCHYDEECGRYAEQCGYCPVLGSKTANDLSRKVWKRKEKIFSLLKNITIVGLSQWLQNSAKNSTLLGSRKVVNLPNPIDTDKFKPFDKQKARGLWTLPQDKKLVLFGAIGATSNPRKGFIELSQALGQLTSEDVEFVVFGSSQPQNVPDFGFKTHYLGSLHDDVSLVTLYSAVDVTIVPSLQENLSNAIMESLACATPVVGFDIGGNSDMVEHQKNGYLAKPFKCKDLAEGIEWVLNAPNYDKLCKNAREKVIREFDSKIVAKKYLELYEDVLS